MLTEAEKLLEEIREIVTDGLSTPETALHLINETIEQNRETFNAVCGYWMT